MRGTVKQFKDMLEEMKKIYPFEDEKTQLSTHNVLSMQNDALEIKTVDEKTGITIIMSKSCKEVG